MFRSCYKYVRQGGIALLFLFFALLISHRTGYITILGLFLITYAFSMLWKAKLDGTSILLLIYSLSYIIISSINGVDYDVATLLLYGIFPFIFYQYGKDVARRWNTNNQHIIFWLIIIACYCIDIFVICGSNIIKTGEIINIKREFAFGDNGTDGLAATLVGLCMDIGVIGLPMTFIVKNKQNKTMFFILFLLSLIVTIHLLNRTGLVIMLLCFALLIVYRSRKSPQFFLWTALGVFVLISSLYYLNILTDELIDLYVHRNKDLSTLGDRSGRWTLAIENIIRYPFGWINYENNSHMYYVHNMWLDIARVSGILPFILLTYLCCSSFISSYKLLSMHESEVSYLLFGLNICFFASCFVEPILGGTHFMLYCLLWGYQKSVTHSAHLTNKYE